MGDIILPPVIAITAADKEDIAKRVWDRLLTDITEAGSIGINLKEYTSGRAAKLDNLDVAVSSRSKHFAARSIGFADNFIHGNDPTAYTESMTAVKLKEINLRELHGSLRIKFDMKTYWGYGDVFGEVRRNGALLASYSTTSVTWVTFTGDFDGWEKNDLCQLYGYVGVEGDRVDLKNFRLYVGTAFGRIDDLPINTL